MKPFIDLQMLQDATRRWRSSKATKQTRTRRCKTFKCCKMLLEDEGDETRPRGCKYPTPPCALDGILPETTVRTSLFPASWTKEILRTRYDYCRQSIRTQSLLVNAFRSFGKRETLGDVIDKLSYPCQLDKFQCNAIFTYLYQSLYHKQLRERTLCESRDKTPCLPFDNQDICSERRSLGKQTKLPRDNHRLLKPLRNIPPQ